MSQVPRHSHSAVDAISDSKHHGGGNVTQALHVLETGWEGKRGFGPGYVLVHAESFNGRGVKLNIDNLLLGFWNNEALFYFFLWSYIWQYMKAKQHFDSGNGGTDSTGDCFLLSEASGGSDLEKLKSQNLSKPCGVS